MDKPSVVIGIDPGQKGAIAVIRTSDLAVLFNPTDDRPDELLGWFKSLQTECHIRALVIERVASLPKVSAKSNFNFGWNVGMINTLAHCLGVMVDHVPPKEWQKVGGIMVPKGTDSTARRTALKKAVAEKAGNLYPAYRKDLYGPRGGLLDGRSDALMIAHFALIKYPV